MLERLQEKLEKWKSCHGLIRRICTIKINSKIRENYQLNNHFKDGSGRWKDFLRSQNLVGWLLCMPALAILGLFFLGPALIGARTSFYEWNGISSTMRFVGLNNYIEVFQKDRFWSAVLINWLAFFGTLLTQMPLALFFAIGLSKQTHIIKVYRSALFAPRILSIAGVGLLWGLVFHPYKGPLNYLLKAIGLKSLALSWLGESNTALISLLLVVIWFYFGFHMLIFLAGLASIPEEYFDAALLETSSWLDTLRYITLPLLREQLLISLVLIFGGSFGGLIGLFYLMTSGGPGGSTELLGIYMTLQAFRANRFGYASAISMITLFIVVIFLIWPVMYITHERLEY